MYSLRAKHGEAKGRPVKQKNRQLKMMVGHTELRI